MDTQSHIKKVTPPGSFIKAPLTPPPTSTRATERVQEILDLLRCHKDGRRTLGPPWRKYRLRRGDYDHLLRLLKQDSPLRGYVEDKIRYVWNPELDLIILTIQIRLRLFDGISRPANAYLYTRSVYCRYCPDD